MPDDGSLLKFLEHSERRVGNLLSRSRKMRAGVNHFDGIVEDLKSQIEGLTVHFYGTRKMQLGHEKSHLNLFLEVDNSYFVKKTGEEIADLMNKLIEYFNSVIVRNALIKQDKTADQAALSMWSAPMKILKTPVPTLRINYKKIQCDMTFNSGLGVENSKLVNHMFSLQPQAFALYHFVRIWIHIDEFSFKRYMVALMVLFFLQNKKLMPTVEQLQEDVPETFIEGWNIEFNKTKTLKSFGMETVENYEDYLIGFFEFYEEFEFESNVMCPYLGKAIPIQSYPKGEAALNKYENTMKGFNKTAVNMADLFNLNFNVAYGVGKKRAKKFRDFCGHATWLLEENL